ncbi:MAG: hypothetical protein KDD55_03985, partial [Bdellovibrionales bacterium]|nr:hypothetical protein [Bdellovibrionales bacterium]
MKHIILSFILFPDDGLAQVYADEPDLSGKSFEGQVSALNHSPIAPKAARLFLELEKNGYEPHVLPVNNMPSQVTWLRANGYHDFNSRRWMQETVLRQIESLKPDILVLPPSLFSDDFLAELQERPRLVIAWWDQNVDESSSCSKYDFAFLENSSLEENAHACQVHHVFKLELSQEILNTGVAQIDELLRARMLESQISDSSDMNPLSHQDELPPADALIVEVLSALNGGEPQKAQDLLTAGKSLFQDYPELHFPLAIAYARLGDLEQAKCEVQELFRFRPNHPFAQQLYLELCSNTPCPVDEGLSGQPFSSEMPLSREDVAKEVDQLLNEAIECLQQQNLSGARERIRRAKERGSTV